MIFCQIFQLIFALFLAEQSQWVHTKAWLMDTGTQTPREVAE